MNNYLVAIEGMKKFLDEARDPMERFNRKYYAESFQNFYLTCVDTFDAIEALFNSVEEPETMIANMANALADAAAEKVDAVQRNSKKGIEQINLNMELACFIFPAILEYKGNMSEPLVHAVEKAWKEHFPKYDVKAASLAEINKGFHRKFCYITTAVCTSFGKSDDCYELQTLRQYRDEFLAEQEGGEEMIRQYYDQAPSIVKHIDEQPDHAQIYLQIWETYLQPCIHMIENGQKEECRDLYIRMVGDLREEYFLK